VGGTNLEEAFKTALRAFEGSQSNSRAIILLTDGEELQGNLTPLISKLAQRKIPVFAVGFGDPVNGAVIPAEPGKGPLVRDRQGKIVTSKLNEKLLSSLASSTKGIYFRTSVTAPGVEELLAAINKLDRQKRDDLKTELPVEEFPKALFFSAFFLR
jgi:Ca-activated chloride channel family protein